MHRVLKKRSTKAGLPPGAMVHVGERKAERVGLSLIEFGPEHYERKDLRRIEDAFPLKPGPVVTWLSVDGLHETAVLEHIGRQFGIHPLILEDILNTDQRPKIEVYDDYIFVVLKTITVQGAADRLDIEQVSLLLGPNYVITFQERAADVFDPVRERIRTNKGRIAKSGPDYLMYALLDMIIDNYFLVLERLGERIDLLEERVIARPDSHSVQDIQILKREMIFLRRSVWPLREVIGRLIREESALVQDATSPYLHDLYDHTVQVADTVETYRDVLSGILDVYLSSISNRTNEVMKLLTIIATLFIPLTFIVGVYGMNFHFMPELGWRWGYPAVWVIMGAISAIMIAYFRRKKWM